MNLTPNQTLHARRQIDWLLKDSRLVEMRVLTTSGFWRNGYFDNFPAMQRAAGEFSGDNCFTSLNRPHDYVDVTNSVGARMKSGSGLADKDIERITRLPFDFDPHRPAGTPSTQAEMLQARDASRRLVGFLQSMGWPEPLSALSGNGNHRQYRVNLPNNDETKQYLRIIYQGLRERFETDNVGFDVTVRSPAQIFRLYGTRNRKGAASPDRPHRLTYCHVPVNWGCVSQRQIVQLAERMRPAVEEKRKKVIRESRPLGSGDYSTLDAVSWFSAHGLYKRHIGSGKHAVTCPWVGEHSTKDHANGSDTVIWERGNSGWPSFNCSHAHCEGRTLRDVLEVLPGADDFCSKTWRAQA